MPSRDARGRSMPRLHRLRLALGLMAVMGTTTALAQSFGLLSPFLISDLGIGTFEIGVLASVASVSAAAAGPAAGRISDSARTETVVAGVAGLTAVSIMGALAAPFWFILMLAASLNGMAMGGGNPLTNRIIHDLSPHGQRGLLIGLKQSGVPLVGMLLAVTVPSIGQAHGWRWALSATLLLPFLAFALMYRPARTASASAASGTRLSGAERAAGRSWGAASATVKKVSAYSGLMGMTTGVLQAYFVLSLVRDWDHSPAGAGAVAAALSAGGVVGRLALPKVAEATRREGTFLRAMAGVSAVASICLALGALWPSWSGWLWILGPALGAAAIGWQSVVMLALMGGDPREVGAASGLVTRMFYLGLFLGPLWAGGLAGMEGAFVSVWSVQAGVCLLALLVVRRMES